MVIALVTSEAAAVREMTMDRGAHAVVALRGPHDIDEPAREGPIHDEGASSRRQRQSGDPGAARFGTEHALSPSDARLLVWYATCSAG